MDPAPSMPPTSLFDRTLGRLPYDAWRECIRFAAMQSVGGPLPFLAVSPSWEESIIASPHLWATIFFDGGEDEEARIHTFSHLSQDLPLYLIHYYSRDGKAMERFINNHALRIQSIEDDPKDDPEGVYEGGGDLSAVLGTISASLPALRYLDSHSKHISAEFLLNCVNLRVLQRPKIRIADEACLGPHVESIRFTDVELDKIAKLTHRTNIQQLELDLCHEDYQPLWDAKATDVFETQMANLFTKIGHSLSNLTLRITFHSYSAFILHLSSIPGLHTLFLRLYIPYSDETPPHLLPPPIHHSDIQNVRVLSVSCYGGDDDTAVKCLMESLTAKHPLRELEILKLRCRVDCPESYIGALIQSAVSAYRIHVSADDMSRISPRFKRQLMPRLQFLQLSPSGLYNCISAPNLRQLTLIKASMVFLEIEAVNDLQKLVFDANDMDYVRISDQSSWNCKSIKYVSGSCPRNITPLSRLEFVEFTSKDNATAENEFLLRMLLNPEACPQLHTIIISYYPLWELLFEVLRRRNSSGLQRITQIRLPRLPVLQLLWRLVRLLSGETSIFTHRDVDEIIAKRVLCPQILCCLRCTQAGYVSCINHSQSPRYTEVNVDVDMDEVPYDLQDLLDLDYPRDEEFIAEHKLLDRWIRPRLLSGYNNKRADSGETHQCDAHSRPGTVIITQDTLDGMSIPPWISTSEIWDANYRGLKNKE